MAKEGIDCHVQIPCSLLKGFSKRLNKGEWVVFRMNDQGHIDFQVPKKCNIISNYYSNEVENEILMTFESNFGQIKKRFIDYVKTGKDIGWTVKDESIIQDFILSCVARQPNIGQDIFSEPIINYFCKSIKPQDFTVQFAAANKQNIVKEMYPDYIYNCKNLQAGYQQKYRAKHSHHTFFYY